MRVLSSRLSSTLIFGGLLACFCSCAMERSMPPYAEAPASLPRGPEPEPIRQIEQIPVLGGEGAGQMYFTHYGTNPTIETAAQPISTFSVDVDTGSYSMARRYLKEGHLPPRDAIRVEEFINAFDYAYPAPTEAAFDVIAESFPSPNRPGYHLLHLGIKGKEIHAMDRKPVNLVFVVDVSGSMEGRDRLSLVKRSLHILVDALDRQDTVTLVAYGSTAETVLKPTSGDKKIVIKKAIQRLEVSGSTNAESGLELGYRHALSTIEPGDVNRVILCSDGVANMGRNTADGLWQRIEDYAEDGVFLTTLGFGMGNYNDTLMEQLADQGDGFYAYVDGIEEAQKLFTIDLMSSLEVIAKDVKIQVQFSPEAISRYRLIGYENRQLAAEDFANDRVDAGEIGAGHTVTALYEVKLTGQGQTLAQLNLRHKAPDGTQSRLVEAMLPTQMVKADYLHATAAGRLSLIVSAFAEKLRGSWWTRHITWQALQGQLAALPPAVYQSDQVRELSQLIALAAAMDEDEIFAGAPDFSEAGFDAIPVLNR